MAGNVDLKLRILLTQFVDHASGIIKQRFRVVAEVRTIEGEMHVFKFLVGVAIHRLLNRATLGIHCAALRSFGAKVCRIANTIAVAVCAISRRRFGGLNVWLGTQRQHETDVQNGFAHFVLIGGTKCIIVEEDVAITQICAKSQLVASNFKEFHEANANIGKRIG